MLTDNYACQQGELDNLLIHSHINTIEAYQNYITYNVPLMEPMRNCFDN